MKIDEYKKNIKRVMDFMSKNGLNLTQGGYTILEFEGFVEMAGLRLAPKWVRIIARGVYREINVFNATLMQVPLKVTELEEEKDNE